VGDGHWADERSSVRGETGGSLARVPAHTVRLAMDVVAAALRMHLL